MPSEFPQAEYAADAIWLRVCRDLWLGPTPAPGDQPVAGGQPPQGQPRREGEPVSFQAAPETRQEPASPSDASSQRVAENRRELAKPLDKSASAHSEGERASPIEVDRPLPLPRRDRLARALRPLARLTRHGAMAELDIETTIRRTVAAHGKLQVAMRPPLRRTVAVDLVVDQSRSMDLWRGLDADLLQLFEGLGAFRRVGLRHLRDDGTGTELFDLSGAKCGLAAEGGARLVLVFSDTIGPGWRSGSLFRWLEETGKQAMVIVVHLFPPSLQDRTALMRLAVAGARSSIPFSPNRDLAWTMRVPGAQGLRAPIPLVALDEEAFKQLTHLAKAGGGNQVSAIAVEDSGLPGTREDEYGSGRASLEALDQLRLFSSTASEQARDLLEVLAVVPLVPEVMRLAQRRFAPQSGHWHLAEIVFGGLVRRMDAIGDPRHFGVWYEFHPGVREEILRRGAVDRQLEILDGIGDFLNQRYAFDARFTALLRDPEGSLLLPFAVQRVFARVKALVYRSVGGKPAELAEHALALLAGDTVKAPGLPSWTTALGITLLEPPVPGEFQMGSPSGEPGRYGDEGPVHTVRLTKPFWLGQTPVTQGQWRAVVTAARRLGLQDSGALNENPSSFKSAGDDAPVENVSWEDARKFIELLNRLPESDGGPRPGWRFSLPTEAQWEYACRAGKQTALYTGGITIKGENDAPELDAIAWYAGNSGVQYEGGFDSSSWPKKQYPHTKAGTHPVKQKLPNVWDFHDMLGNVWEWCADYWGPYESGEMADPTGPKRADRRVVRGGSWGLYARNCRAAFRDGWFPGFRDDDRGFRLAAVPASGDKDEDGGKDGEGSEGRADRPVRSLPLSGGVSVRMRELSAGQFLMGSPDTEKERSADETPHEVTLTEPFWLGESPVTQAQWEAVMEKNPSRFKGADLPVENVSWEEALEFCKRLTARLHTAGDLPRELELTLPTEAQWEYACRGGTATPYYFGAILNGAQANCDGNYPYGTAEKGPYLAKTSPVGAYANIAPHPWGLLDMHGNVWEWCWDWYGEYGGGKQTDPTGPASGDLRVMRGGCWSILARCCRAADRSRWYPGLRFSDRGFRLAAVPAGTRRRQSGAARRGTSATPARPEPERPKKEGILSRWTQRLKRARPKGPKGK